MSGGPPNNPSRTALVCTRDEAALAADLAGTVLWRSEFQRVIARSAEEARETVQRRPDLVLVEADLHWAGDFVRWLRTTASTRRLPVAALVRGENEPQARELLGAGANAVLRVPVRAEWDRRIARLLDVAARREARFPVHFEVAAGLAPGHEALLAMAVDLSEHGMLIESSALRPDQDVRVAFQLPGRPGLISGRARVVRRSGADRVGIEFVDLDGAALAEIRSFVDLLPAAPSPLDE